MLLPQKLNFSVEGAGADGGVGLVKRVHRELDVELVDVREEVLDAVLVPDVVQHDEAHVCAR